MLHETWAYPDYYYVKEETGQLDRPAMDALMKEAYQKLSKETGLSMIPVGDAFETITVSANPIRLNIPLDKHANANGNYLAAAMFYETLFHDNVTRVGFVPKDVSPDDAKMLRDVAHQTLEQTAAPK